MKLWMVWKRLWIEKRNRLWVLPILHCIGAVLLALMAAWVPALIPGLELPEIALQTLDNLLTVIASSMLAVTTFSLSIMVSAFASASNGVTPRATELVMGDEGTHNAISNFISAFIFSIVSQVALGLKYYGNEGRFLLFVGTCAVLVWLMQTLLRWVRTLSSLGRFGNTLERVYSAALETLTQYWLSPYLNAQPAPADIEALAQSPHSTRVHARDLQMVRRIDMEALQQLAQARRCTIHLRVRPGAQVSFGTLMAVAVADHQGGLRPAAGVPDDPSDPQPLEAAIAACIHLDAERTFDQDPRFGVIVLREAAQRALSAAINDPGSAIACLNSITRVLLKSQFAAEQIRTERVQQQQPPPAHWSRLSIVGLEVHDFLDDAFAPAARDGGASVEIMVRLQKLLHLLSQCSPNAALASHAREQAVFAYECAMQAFVHPQDKAMLQALHTELFGAPPAPPEPACA